MRSFFGRLSILFVACSVALIMFAVDASSHAQVETSSPEADALLAVPPMQVAVTFSEPVDITGVTISAIDEDGRAVSLGAPRLDPASDRRITATSSGFSIGTYTISWTNRSSTDGHTLTGSFAFRVGGTDRAPAAATVEGQRPAAWAVVVRWASFLGCVAAIGLLICATTSIRRRLAATGLLLALLATLLEPVLLSVWPPPGSTSASVGSAIRAEPSGWWIRLFGVLGALLLALVPIKTAIRRYAVGAAALVSLGGLALTSHAAGRESYASAAVAITFLHNATVALWVGALVLITAAPDIDRWSELRQFARRALPLALVAVTAGIVNAAFIVPSLSSLSNSDYGRVLIVKVAAVAIILMFAAYHHTRLRRRLSAVPLVMRRSVRAELGFIAIAVALASTLALLATPQVTRGEFDRIELGMPTRWETTDEQIYVRLGIEPLKQDETSFTVYATDGPPLTVERDANGDLRRVDHPPIPDVQLVRIAFTSLMTPIPTRTLDLAAVGDGRFTGSGLIFSADGWWRALVTVRRPGVAEDLTAEFVLRSPDPNFVGINEAVTISASNPDAEALYQQALALMRSEPWVVYRDAVSGGGGVESGTQVYADGAYNTFSPNVRIVLVDGKRYFQGRDGTWSVSDFTPPAQSTWMSEYEGATNFVLGNQEAIDGRLAQPIMFYVPATELAAAFYGWWIDVETGQIVKIAMISRNHYMNRVYDWSAKPAPITAPV